MWTHPKNLDALTDGTMARILTVADDWYNRSMRPSWEYGPYRGGFIQRGDDGRLYFVDGKFEVPIESTRMVQVPKVGKEDKERGAAG